MKKFSITFLTFVVLLGVHFTANAQRGGSRGGGASRQYSRPQPSARPSQPSTRPSQPITRPSQPSTLPSQPSARPSQPNNPPSQLNTRPVQGGGNNQIHIDNSKNVIVRPPARPYPYPPHYHGGYGYHCYHPYHPYPYHPYYYGPAFHPVGFFVVAVAVTSVVISNQNQTYYYDNGVYYVKQGSGYVVVSAPPGVTVKTLPENTQTVVVNETTNNYYYGGTYYEKSDSGYTVVPPTAGTLVPNLPEGGEEVTIGEVKYVKIGEVYYQPTEVNGKQMYEVVNVVKQPETKVPSDSTTTK